MYSCEAEHSHELSFPQGAHFSNGEQKKRKHISTFNCLLVSRLSLYSKSVRIQDCKWFVERLIGSVNTVHTEGVICLTCADSKEQELGEFPVLKWKVFALSATLPYTLWTSKQCQDFFYCLLLVSIKRWLGPQTVQAGHCNLVMKGTSAGFLLAQPAEPNAKTSTNAPHNLLAGRLLLFSIFSTS